MSYQTISARLVSLLQGVDGFDANNVALEDYTVLNSGQNKGIVVSFKAFRNVDSAFGGEVERIWSFGFRHYTRMASDLSTTLTNQATERQNIITRMEQYPTLNRLTGVILAGRFEEASPALDDQEIGGVSYMIEEFNIMVTELVTVTEAE